MKTVEQDEGAGPRVAAPTQWAIDRIEGERRIDPVVDALARVASRTETTRAGSVLRGDWLGHAVHPLLTDLPLGCWTSATLLDLVGGGAARVPARRLVGLGVLLSVPTAAAGLAELPGVRDDGSRRVAAVHAVGNSVALGCYTRSWLVRRHGSSGRLWALLGGGVATFTGFLGGHLSLGRAVGTGIRTEEKTSEDAGRPNGAPDPEAQAQAQAEAPVDVGAAAAMLDVGVEQVLAMVDEGMLTPVGVDGSGPVFAPAEVLATRLLGG